MTNGFFIIDKPAGPTSHDVVKHIRGIVGQRRVGHAGTLDPFASGILIVATGHATRLLEYVHDLPKTYTTTVILGARSTTDDSTGDITPYLNASAPTEETIHDTIQKFIGHIEQVPPAYAAIKIAGKKLYEYAREGTTIEAPPRPVTIHDIQIHRYAFPRLELTITCSTGTYIRSLARDIGERIGIGGYAAALRRTAIGNWNEAGAVQLKKLMKGTIATYFHTPEELIEHMNTIRIPDDNVAKFQQGRAIELSTDITPFSTKSTTAVFDLHHKFIGIGAFDPITHLLSPLKVFSVAQ